MSYRDEYREAYKALSRKQRAKLYRELSDYERTTELVTFHGDTMTVDEMRAFTEFAGNLTRHHEGVRFSGLGVRREKSFKELKETVSQKAYYRR